MSRTLQLFTFLAIAYVSAASGAGNGDRLYSDAQQAIGDGIPEVGIQKLKQYLAGDVPAALRAEATLKLAGAQLDAGYPEDALLTLGKSGDGAEVEFLKAQVLSALGRWDETAQLFHKIDAGKNPQLSARARQGEAEARYALNRLTEAIALLESLPDAGTGVKLRLADFYFEAHEIKKCEAVLAASAPVTPSEIKWKKYLEGRLLLSRDKAPAALAKFGEIVREPQGAGEALMVGATLGITEARLALNGAEAADNVLEDFIRQHPDSCYLDLLFRRLDQIYANEENTSEAELQKWSQIPPARRRALAEFYLAKGEFRAKKLEKALADLEGFTRDFPEHPLVAKADILLGAILMETGKPDGAMEAYEAAMRKAPDGDALAEAEIAAGRLHFRQREYVLSANMFRSAAGHSERLWQTAMFNAALAWLNQGNFDKFIEDYKQLSARFPEGNFRRDLLLEEGLLQARSGDPRARESLRIFIRDFPDHARVAEARLALAEICFLSSDFSGAGNYLRAVNATPQSIGTSDRAEYLALFLADAAEPRDEQKVIAACRKFILERGKSSLLPEVRMKLGQIYFRGEDFANAQTQFELLAAESPGTPYAEMALYLAGKSAMQSMNSGATDRALELFEEVKKLNGPLKLYALQQQALIKSRLGLESEAVILYDNILGSKPDADLKFAALCGKGDDWFSTGSNDPKALDQAIVVFDELSKDPDATPFWRNQALYKKGKCLEKQNKQAEALTVFYDVLGGQPGTGEEPDYFWYYKAGFDTARMLETQEQWKSAIGIYKKMAAVNGPRSKEAGERATQMRMEHFIWEE
jgi:tetratricopeptide (TPR) repeat protein